jgi:hypothetical protein
MALQGRRGTTGACVDVSFTEQPLTVTRYSAIKRDELPDQMFVGSPGGEQRGESGLVCFSKMKAHGMGLMPCALHLYTPSMRLKA